MLTKAMAKELSKGWDTMPSNLRISSTTVRNQDPTRAFNASTRESSISQKCFSSTEYYLLLLEARCGKLIRKVSKLGKGLMDLRMNVKCYWRRRLGFV